MTLDTVLNILGLAISVGALVAAKLKRQVYLAIFVCSLIVTTGVSSWLALTHEREISRVETELKATLANNRWTFDDIFLQMRDPEMHDPDSEVLHEALSRAIADKTVKDDPTQCITTDGPVLSTRVFYLNTKTQ